jgi:FixJ family two-component response regulator
MSKSEAQIAILDDDASVRKALVRLFHSSLYHVAAYASAGEFLRELNQGLPKCLIADLQMPNMTGYELLCHLKRAEIHIPTIIITAFDEPGTRAGCLAAGAFVYLLKPIRKAVLMAAVDDSMRNT